MLFLLQEELHRAPASVMRRICRFLEVNPDYQFQRLNEKANVTWRPRSILLQRLGFKVYSRLQYGYRGYQLIRTLNSRSKPGYPLMKPATCRTLTEYFAPHNHRLEQLTGLDLTLWNQTVSEGSQADDSDTTVTAEDLDGIP